MALLPLPGLKSDKTPQTEKPAKEPKAPKAEKPAKAPKPPKAEKAPKAPLRERRLPQS